MRRRRWPRALILVGGLWLTYQAITIDLYLTIRGRYLIVDLASLFWLLSALTTLVTMALIWRSTRRSERLEAEIEARRKLGELYRDGHLSLGRDHERDHEHEQD